MGNSNGSYSTRFDKYTASCGYDSLELAKAFRPVLKRHNLTLNTFEEINRLYRIFECLKDDPSQSTTSCQTVNEFMVSNIARNLDGTVKEQLRAMEAFKRDLERCQRRTK